ncbi:MAG: hypothetical protein WA373_06345 [Burkholderiales bacterium]
MQTIVPTSGRIGTRVAPLRRQRGVVLFIALIVLVAMTLAGIAAVRSVDTTNQIAGNLAFKQSTTMGADAAIENARNWLLTQIAAGALESDNVANGYFSYAATSSPGIETDWTNYNWTSNAAAKHLTPPDAAGNDIYYVIQRMCKTTGSGSASANSCLTSLSSGAAGTSNSSKGAGIVNLIGLTQYYYRVSVRATGPRNTVSYVQAMIAL